MQRIFHIEISPLFFPGNEKTNKRCLGFYNYLRRLYPHVNDGEGWYGAVRAREIIESFFKRNH